LVKKEPLPGFLCFLLLLNDIPEIIRSFKQEKINLLLQQIFFLKNQNHFILPGIGWLIFTTILLTLPVSAFPKERWIIKIPMLDKWVHVGMFTIMVVLLCWGYYKKKLSAKLKHSFIMIGIYCLLYGIIMEFVQKYFVPNRSFDTGDIIADGTGAVIGVMYSVKRYIKK